MMKLTALMNDLGFRILVPACGADREIRRIYAGDRMSDLLSAASEDTLVITHVANQSIIRLIELMDLPAVCFLNGLQPDTATLDAARTANTCLMSSPLEMYETCGRFHELLNKEQEGPRHV